MAGKCAARAVGTSRQAAASDNLAPARVWADDPRLARVVVPQDQPGDGPRAAGCGWRGLEVHDRLAVVRAARRAGGVRLWLPAGGPARARGRLRPFGIPGGCW